MSRFTHQFWRALITKISEAVDIILQFDQFSTSARFKSATVVCSISFMKNQNAFEEVEMG